MTTGARWRCGTSGFRHVCSGSERFVSRSDRGLKIEFACHCLPLPAEALLMAASRVAKAPRPR
jgi:hypothetical protein